MLGEFKCQNILAGVTARLGISKLIWNLMFLYQCNCESCRRLNGSLSIGACYREGEFSVEGGEEVRYDYKGGSGQMMFTSFCPDVTSDWPYDRKSSLS